MGTITPGQSGPGSNSNEVVFSVFPKALGVELHH